MTSEQPPYESAQRTDAPARSANGVAMIAVVAFVFGVLINGYIALSILDGDGSAASSGNDDPIIVPSNPTAEPTATTTPLPDRTDCEEIRGTDYRSPAERQFFLANCTNQAEPSPTIDPTQLPPLDGGTSTDAVDEDEGDEDATPTPEEGEEP